MWWTILYVVLALVAIALGVVWYLFKKGLNKVKPDPLKGIPIPPLTHSLLGHPDKMLHPLKHELRLEVCEAARGPFHQLVMMKHASVFINDAAEAGRLLEEMTIKGAIYNAFRYDANIPDLLSSDGDAWEVRKKALYPALNNIHVASEDNITSALLAALTKYSETVEPVDLVGLCTSVAFDAVCDAAFGYQLGAVAGSEDGKRIYKTLCTLHDAQANVGIYANANARKVPPEEIAEAKAFWKGFLNKLLAVIRTDSEQYRSRHGELDTEKNFGHALIQLSVTEEAYGDAQLISEIHQIIRHGYETITGTLVWLFYALYRFPKVRAKLETELSAHKSTASAPYPEYLDHIILETMRRYPVAGNMTVRTVDKADFQLVGGYPVPVGTPIHLHMWSLQNTTRTWEKPKEFKPDRWSNSADIDTDTDTLTESEDGTGAQAPGAVKPSAGPPRCPFMAATGTGTATSGSNSAYDGAGHSDGALSFFPFSAGARACPAQKLALQVLRRVLADVVLKFRLDPYEAFWDEDLGASVNATIMPMLKKSTTIKVKKVTAVGTVEEVVKEVQEDGWADEDDDEEKYQKVEVPTTTK